MTDKKILILDGIGGATLGRDIHACIDNSEYYDLAKLENISLYKPRSAFTKVQRKLSEKNSFYYLPKKRFESLLSLIEEIKPDSIFVIGFLYRFIKPNHLADLAKTKGIKLYLYDTDSCNLYSKRREFIYFIENEVRVYDRVFSFSKVVTEFFNRKNINTIFSPFGANLVEAEPAKYQHDVLFVGSADLRRCFMLEHIADYVSIKGNRWKRNQSIMSPALQQKVDDKPLWGQELYQHLVSSKIVLNITRGPFYAAETGVNLRIFEAMAAGCFVLTDYCDEVADLFVFGSEMETCKRSKALVEKVLYYLSNDDARLAIAKRGQQKISQHYTWKKRVEYMLSYMD